MSKGTPSEAGLKQDAQAALDWLLQRQQRRTKARHCSLSCVAHWCLLGSVDSLPARADAAAPVWLQIVLLGKSLGGAVSIYLAAARPGAFEAVIVENTFTCLEDVAGKVCPPCRVTRFHAGTAPCRQAEWLRQAPPHHDACSHRSSNSPVF